MQRHIASLDMAELREYFALFATNWHCWMNSSDSTAAQGEPARRHADAGSVLAREAGVAFPPPLANDVGIDPIAEWLSLVEVVQMLCPEWPVRDRPFRGNTWRP